MARVRLLGPWSCRVGIELLVWPPGGHSGGGASWLRSENNVLVLGHVCGAGKVSGQ